MDELIKKDNSLAPIEPSETYEEALSRQFYEWERRGRGWLIHDHPVELEPPFRPFFFFEPAKAPVTDDGRIPGFLSKFLGGSFEDKNGSLLSLSLQRSRNKTREYEEYLAEIDEPEFCSHYLEDFREIRLLLPNARDDGNIQKSVAEQLLLSLAYTSHPISFEIIGSAERIVIQFAASDKDAAQLKQQLAAHLPGCTLLENNDGDHLTAHWINSGSSGVIVDFGLSEEFMLPLNTIRGFETDPLMAVIASMSNLEEDEIAIFQIVFKKAKNDWPQEIVNILQIFDGTDFFSHIPDIRALTRQKLDTPLFATVIRVAAKSSDDGSAWRIVRNVGGGLASLSRPAGNELIPLSNDGYEYEHHERALLDRQSFRCGMLLNTDELVSLVHPPSRSVRSERLERENGRTKAAPKQAVGHSLTLGENHHIGKINNVSLSDEQRTRHIHIIGSSGSGKSTLLLNLIKQDMTHGQGVCVIDPHGDLIDDVIANVPDARMDDVILFDPSDAEFPIGFNILRANTEFEKTILSSDLVAAFRRMSTSWGDVMDSVLANAVLAIVESSQGGTLFDLKRFLVEKQFRDEFLKTVSDQAVRYFWQHEFPLIAGKPQGSILIRLDSFLRQKLIRNIVCQKETKLNFREIMDSGKILLIKLSQGLIGEENSHLLGTLLVSKIYQTALTRQDTRNRPYFWLYLDEFQHFITPSMEKILSGSRKYNLGMTLSHQEYRQLQSRDAETASSVMSNCHTRICFRLGDADAEKFASGFSFFDAKSLQNLGIGEAVARIERSEFDFNLEIEPPRKTDQEEAEVRMLKISKLTRSRYAATKEEVEKTLFPDISNDKEKPFSNKLPIRPKPSHTDTSAYASKTITDQKIEEMPNLKNSVNPVPVDSQHRYLQNLVKRIAESKGYRTVLELSVHGGIGKIDVALENDQRKIACEIAITNTIDYELKNIRKCQSAGFTPVVILSSDPKHLTAIKKKCAEELSKQELANTAFLMPDEFYFWLESLGSSAADKVKGFDVKVDLKSGTISGSKGATKKTISQVMFGAFRKFKKPDKTE